MNLNTIDATAESITAVKQSVALAHESSEELRARIDAAQLSLINVMEVDDADDLRKLARRLDRIQELRRMMELGSLIVEANRALEAAWSRLP
jgi:predicted transcriptional regulator